MTPEAPVERSAGSGGQGAGLDAPLPIPRSPLPATDSPLPVPRFQTGTALGIAAGHFVHDMFASFVAPLLPLIIDKLGLSLALAGALAAFQQAPSLINPLLGAAADRVNLRRLIVLAPTVTAVAMSAIGLAPSYEALAVLLLVAGLSIAAWHVPAPAMLARVSGRQVGLGMSFFMIGGELAYTVGPLLVTAALGWWGLEGTWRLMPLGLVASVIVHVSTRGLETRTPRRSAAVATGAGRQLLRVLLPLAAIVMLQGFMISSIGTYLPTFLTREGRSLLEANAALSVIQAAGAIGVFITGPLSDRIGRRRILATLMVLGPLSMWLFLQARDWAIYPALFLVGLTAYSANPVMMALVQEHGRAWPATANGLYMAIQFAGRSLIIIAAGALADRWGLRLTYQWSTLVALCAVPFVFALPGRSKRVQSIN